MKHLSVLVLTWGVVLAPVIGFAQSQTSSGDIKGVAIDANGAPVPTAKATVSAAERGFTRSVAASESGEFRVVLVPPGIYRVRVEAPGFNAFVIDSVEVRVGDTVSFRAPLTAGTVSTEVVVAAELPVVEPDRTQRATTIDAARLRNLPINRRNYLDFALLAPGVVETVSLVDGTDFRPIQSPHSGLSFGGGNGRGNIFAIDGVENYSNNGGVRPGVSQETVQEFQVNQNNFSAEAGGAVGGSVNIVTKSGTNEVHGSMFGYLRHRAIQARNYFDSEKSAYRRGQYGLTYGTPLAHDQTYFFGSFERLDRNESVFVPILQDRTAFTRLTASQQELASFMDNVAQLRPVAAGMRQSLITTNFPATLRLFDANSGVFPFDENNNQALFRVDHHFNPRHSSFGRVNFSKGANENAQFGALSGLNRGRTVDTRDITAMFSHIWIPKPRWVSETRAMLNQYRIKVDPNDVNGPETNITGFGFFGREIFQPFAIWERHYTFQENISHLTGRHSVKFGYDFQGVRDHVRSFTFFGGRFNFGEAIPLGDVLNSATGDPRFASTLISTLNASGRGSLAANVMAPISALQAYNLGLPLLYQQGFGDPVWIEWKKRHNLFIQDTISLRPNLTLNVGMRYELEVNQAPVPTDPNNIAPRIGFAWSPTSDGRTVVRGGFGLFYGQINSHTGNLPANLDGVKISQAFLTIRGFPGLTNPATGRPLTAPDVYQTLMRQGVIGRRQITRDDISQFNLNPGPNSPGRVIFGIVPDFVNPYAMQSHFEVERAIGPVALSAGYSFIRGAHMVRNLDRNLFYAGRTADDQPRFGFYDPSILQRNVLESTANSFYHAATLQLTKRFSRHFALNAHYTLSKAIDDVTDFNSDFQPHDQLNALADRALSAFHQKHRFVANAVIESPFHATRGAGWMRNALGDFLFSPIVMANSYRPFNVLAGVDNLGDNHPNTHRPLGAGRNIGIGPNFFTADLRLTRRFHFGSDGRRTVEAIAEGFNLLNRTNFRSVNNTVGNVRLQDLPNPLVGIRAAPTMPLAYTSAQDPRQFQLGVRLSF